MNRKVINRKSVIWNLFFIVILSVFAVSDVQAQAFTMEWQKAYDWDSQMSTGDQAYDIQPTNDNGYVLAGRTNLDPLWDARARVTKVDNMGNVVWDKLFGDSTATCYLSSIRQAQDGGYIALGSVIPYNFPTGMSSGFHGGYDLLVLKLDALGNVQWHKCLGGSSSEEPGAIRQTADGGYIISASTSSNDGDVPNHHHFNINDQWSDVWLVRLDALGNIIWQNTYGGSSEDNAAALEILPDGSFIVCGNTSSNDGDVSGNHNVLSTDGWVIKVNATGTLLWQKCFGSVAEERFFDVKPTAGNGFIVAGYNAGNGGQVTGFHGGYYDGWVVKLNEIGNMEWQKSIGGSGRDMAGSVKQLPNGSYVVAGEGNSNDGDVPAASGQRDVWTCYLSGNGAITNTQNFGGPEDDGYFSGWSAMYLGVTIIPTHDNGLAIAATTQSPNMTGFVDNGEFYMIKLKGGCDTSITVVDTIICNHDPFLVTLTSTAIGADNYRWVNSVTGPTITVVQPGTYFCNALTGCNFHVDTIHVLLPVALPENLGLNDINICAGSDFILGNSSPAAGIQYLWNTGEQLSFIHPEQAGTYSLTISNGCDSKEDSAVVTLIKCDQCLFIPNVFSPNADGLNDVFNVRRLCEIRNFEMQVYNRWGQVVFHANNIAEQWDGTYRNNIADVGVYYYQISFTAADDAIQYRKGDLTLIR